MMTSLFSSFDPTSSLNLVPNWMSLFLILMILPKNLWIMQTKFSAFMNSTMMFLHKEMKMLLSNSNVPGTSTMFISLLFLIMMNNFMGLFPHIFTTTSHMLTTLTLALPMWLAFMLFGWINSTKHMLAHLVPTGTPSALMMFMVLIETTSNVIRPITLSIRLAANMIAGHLLMTLLGNQGPALPMILISGLLTAQFMLILLESAVALIQSYVFTTLSVLYSSEVNYVNF